jgi:hypothetical protein
MYISYISYIHFSLYYTFFIYYLIIDYSLILFYIILSLIVKVVVHEGIKVYHSSRLPHLDRGGMGGLIYIITVGIFGYYYV